jgi:adenylyl-sulfate kinase
MANVFWFTGISGAGKTTLSRKAYEYLKSTGCSAHLLDGNSVRDFFDNDLGYSEADRHEAIKRIVFGSNLLLSNDISVIVACIAAREKSREFIRHKLGTNYIEIWVKASLETVKSRDVRGLYQSYEKGIVNCIPGVDQVYEEPRCPHLVVDTDKLMVEESFELVCDFVKQQTFSAQINPTVSIKVR